MAITRIDHLQVNRLDVQNTVVSGGTTFVDLANAATDEKAKVSSNDTTPGFLNGKLVAGANVTLTENNNGGNETLTISAAGGATGFTASQNTSSPNDTVNASRLLVDAATTNADIVLSPKGTGSISAHLANGLDTGGNKRGSYAVDLQTLRSANTSVASGLASVIVGGNNNRVSGQQSSIVGGANGVVSVNWGFIGGGSNNQVTTNNGGSIVSGATNLVTGQNSFTGAGGNNTVSAQNGFIGAGSTNTVSGSQSAIASGSSNTASSTASFIGAGDSCNISGSYSFIGSGQTNVISIASYAAIICGFQNRIESGGAYSVCSGLYAEATMHGQRVHSAGRFSVRGDCQHEIYVVSKVTTSGTVATLTPDISSSISSTNKISIESDATYTFNGIITARNQSANEAAGYEVKGVIWNNAGTTSFLGTPTVTVLAESVVGWDLQLVADDTNDSLNINVIGEVGKTIAWGGCIQLMKVKY